MKNHMAINQWGQTQHDLGPYPRSELLRRLHRTHAEKMYVDNTQAGTLHIGWVVAGQWFTVYEVKRMAEVR